MSERIVIEEGIQQQRIGQSLKRKDVQIAHPFKLSVKVKRAEV
jgi:hypothetical protein